MAGVNGTDPALTALDSVYDYLHREAPFYADHVVQQIFGSVDRLEDHPLSGRKVPEAERDDIREVDLQGIPRDLSGRHRRPSRHPRRHPR